MDWGTLVAAVSGGSLAMAGTVLADHLRHRHEQDRGLGERRRAIYLDFIAAAEVCHTRLRALRDAGADTDLAAESRAALAASGIYEARERLFIDASTGAASAGQAMFEQLRRFQRTVGEGHAPESAAYHDAYHSYIGAVWDYRVAVRGELDGKPLAPAEFGWRRWDGRDRCELCAATGQA
ncbi:CchlQ [Streptomyces sp. TRM66268-LWL]|uniref:CchlQ n=1 Tax=Streptomyces polyasparticus TaxID=2767826 RepID=A0ABR7SKE2_9ACTN|nr:CchlQ [Streptomyces polyasparticus]MBC9715062.1 CchlQ [Streptomyces polyasparticus]